MTGKLHKVPTGQNGLYLYTGFANFVTTGTTLELDVPFKTIEAINLTYAGQATAAANGPLACNEALVSNTSGGGKIIKVPATGTITITRAAGTDSAAGFSFAIWGK